MKAHALDQHVTMHWISKAVLFSSPCSEGIVSWIKKKTGPFAVTVDAADKLAELEKESPVLMVAYFKEFSVSVQWQLNVRKQTMINLPFFSPFRVTAMRSSRAPPRRLRMCPSSRPLMPRWPRPLA